MRTRYFSTWLGAHDLSPIDFYAIQSRDILLIRSGKAKLRAEFTKFHTDYLLDFHTSKYMSK